MKDESLLLKLRELRDLNTMTARDTFIDTWIESTQFAIATESAKNVGFGTSMKGIQSILKGNAKRHPEWSKVIRSHGNACIITDGCVFIKIPSDLGLPATSLQKDYADSVLCNIDYASKVCGKAYTPPSRAELDYIIKDWKATPKHKGYPIYSFDDSYHTLDANRLIKVLEVFPSAVMWVNPKDKSNSPVYFKWETFEAVLIK